jgi:hypothetical protein
MAITVPGTMSRFTARAGHRGATVYYEAASARRAIPEAKLAAVKAVLTADGDSDWGIDYGGSSGTFRDGRGFRIWFKAGKDEAAVTTFLAAVETAVTT